MVRITVYVFKLIVLFPAVKLLLIGPKVVNVGKGRLAVELAVPWVIVSVLPDVDKEGAGTFTVKFDPVAELAVATPVPMTVVAGNTTLFPFEIASVLLFKDKLGFELIV